MNKLITFHRAWSSKLRAYLQSVSQDPQSRPRPPSTRNVQLRRVFVGQVRNLPEERRQLHGSRGRQPFGFGCTNLTGHDGRQALLFIHQHQVLERPGLEEEGVSLLQRHGRGELGLVIIIPQVGDLVKVTNTTTTERIREETMTVTGNKMATMPS